MALVVEALVPSACCFAFGARRGERRYNACGSYFGAGEATRLRRGYGVAEASFWKRAFAQVIRRAKAHKISHRTAAMAIGVERVMRAKHTRGLFP